MNPSLLFPDQISSIAKNVLPLLQKIEPASHAYNTELHHAMKQPFFSHEEQESFKKKISLAYFRLGITLKDIFSETDPIILPLTDIMRQADRDCSVETIAVCNRILEAYMQLQDDVGIFCAESEESIVFSEQIPLNDLSVLLRRLIFHANQSCLALEETIKLCE